MITRILRSCLVFALAVGLAVPAGPARADIQQALNRQLNALTTVSQPGVYEAAMARTATGGYIRVRNRITNLNVVGFQPPSFSAGCGGIDFFGGSFSFINAAQFTQLLRTIAANAAGYAFAIALEQLCPICMKTIAMLQKLIQDMNAMLGNSCQLAQGVVNDVARSLNVQVQNEASVIRQFRGFGDAFEAFLNSTTGGSSYAAARTEAPADVEQWITGNVVWRAMAQAGTDAWFIEGGDVRLREFVMTLVGTAILGPDGPAPLGADPTPAIKLIGGRPELLQYLIDGARDDELEILACGTSTTADGCLDPGMQVYNFDGLLRRLENAMLGDGTGPGALCKLQQGLPLTAEERLIVGLVGEASVLLRIAHVDCLAAEQAATVLLPHMALDLAVKTTNEIVAVVQKAMAGEGQSPAYYEATQILRESFQAIRGEARRLHARYGDRAAATANVLNWMNIMSRLRPVPGEQPIGGAA
ncbi:MAG: hypothetical protein EA356_12475 [Geminicoccaceae bacterium]|nr:MAG: hypothetical protein EA356_12475 [Geminicoccaceae bacterium]